MAVLDVTNVRAVVFEVETVVTAPDSNQFTAAANIRYGVPDKQTAMTVDNVSPVQCMTKGTFSFRNNNVFQLFTVDEVRTPV